MRFQKPSRKSWRSLCAEALPDDGLDPRKGLREKRPEAKARRKARQLCGQVAEALDAVLAGDCGDDVLRDLQVVAVEPAPDASRLLVTVRVHSAAEGPDPGLVLAHLARASGLLRCGVAAAITRKRAPVLAYRLALRAGGEPS